MTSREPPPVDRFRPADLEQDWNALRSACPVAKTKSPGGTELWLMSGHSDIRAVLADARFRVTPAGGEANESIFQDPPEHTRLRGLVAGHFTLGRIEAYRPAIEAMADDLLGALEPAAEPVDLMEAFARPLSMNAICEIVGVPPADRELFRRLADQLLVSSAEAFDPTGWQRLNEYVTSLIAARRREPRETVDLISHLLGGDDAGSLTDVELTTMILGLPIAGYVSTANAIALAFRHLLNGGWLDTLRSAAGTPELQRSFVEELLRMQSGDNGESMPRFASADVRWGEVTIAEGEMVVAPLIAANRDDTVFPAPETFDPHRAGLARHIAFGTGVHRCLGANLARLELQCALAAIVRADVGFELALAWAHIPWSSNLFGDRYPDRLPVTVEKPVIARKNAG
ncbi:cytochrome P450 [Amycolatopsis sp. cg5]|uniref:cytochrome P450 n=1 Tax=Amycolatopsis sp. cg5 TaxID=3238802 RepID=UPI00352405DE